jgi:VCBS repeat-containing protein
VVTGVASGNESSNNTIITNNTGVGSAVSGTYGSLNIAANGTYTYTASSTNNIAYDATATDIFTFTTRDDESNSGSNAYDVGTITFTVASSISLTDDTDSVNEDATITKTGSQDDVLNDDAADTNGLVVTHIKKDGGSNSTVASSSTYTSNGTSVTGTYGTLVIGADGSYTYTADLSAADDLDLNDEVTDVFVYTADGATANLTITVTGINDVPTAADKTVTTNEDTAYVFSASDFGYTDADDHDALVSVKITGLEDAGALQYNNGSAWVDVTENQVITATDIAANKLRFNPTANENGSSYTSFDFTVNDGDADSASANTITVNVTAVNDAPTARDDTGIVNEDATLTVSNSSDATTSVTAASFVRSKSLGDAGYQSQETKFSPDGTKMFVLDTYQNTNEIHQYTLTTAFDISSASFDGADETFDLSNENSSSSNFTFNNDGTKFYSAYSGRLYEYDVSTAYDISTSSYNNNFFDLILEYPNTRNMGSGVNVAFNSDGTKLFALDAQQREVHEYSLSTAFDVTSASRTNNYVSVGTQEASPYGFAFSNDGKKMFISGLGADVNEYTLSTGFDLSSTFEFVGSFDVSSKDSYPLGITFNNDGTKMFVTGSQQDKLFEYSLTSPFSLIDVSGEHSGDVINTSSTDNYDTDPEGDSLTVTTYSHTSATDQDGGSISSTSSTGTAGTNNVTGYYGTLDLEGNGSYTYTADLTVTQALDSGDTVTDIFTYTVDDGNGGTDTATITITVIGMNDTPVAQNDVGVIVEDGTLNVSGNANVTGSYDATGEHSGDVIDTSSSSHTDSDADASASLTVSAIRTGSSEGSGTAGSIGSALTGTYGQLTIAADGSYSYVANQDAAVGDSVTESFNYTLSDGTATDIGVITITILGVNDAGFIKEGGTLTVANSAAANSGASTGNHTGDITDNGSNITSITATTAGGNAQTTFSSNSETVIGEYGTLTINSDGSYSYVANSNISGLDAGDANIKDVFTYIVSDGSTTSTATLTMNIIASQDLTARDDNGTVNEDATLEVDDGDNLTTVAPASYDDSDSFTIAGSNLSSATTQSNFKDLLFNPDGTKMYTLGSASGLSGRSLFQYTLSIPFDVSTASVSSDDHITVGGSYTTDNEAMRFNNDGTKLFVLFDSPNQNTSSYMYQYTLSTPYDITSTVTAGNSLRLGNQYKNYRTFLFNDDGSEMFISEVSGIYKYTLSTSFDTSTASKTSSYLSASVTGMQYNNDGTKLFTVYQTTTIGSTAKISQWSLSTAYDPTTASSDTSTYFDTGETTGSAGNGVPTQFITFNNDGSKFFSFNHTIGHGSSDPVKIKEWNLASPFNLTNDVNGEHSGDVINTSSTANYDTDPDSDTLTVTAIRTGSSEGSGTVGSVGSALTGTYGQLTIAANGSYTYVANQDAADALDPGDVVTDTFNYTVSDGQGETDIAVLTITVNGINDTPVADAETGSVDTTQTLTVTDGTSDLLHGDTDADASASLSVSSIVATTASGSATAVNPGTAYNSGYTSVTGSKGTLRVGADGTYQYIAGSSTGTDVFTYTLSDGTATHTATLTITVNSSNNAPSATDDTDAVNEDATITESSGSKLLVSDDTDADGNTLTVTQIAVTGGGNSSVTSSTTHSNGTSITGTYGTLVVGANGSYTYTADQSAADDLDASDTVTDSFTYTISDGTDTDTATLIITVTGINDAPVADNETGSVNEDATLTVTDGTSDVLHGDTDADDSASLTVSAIRTGAEDGSGTSGSIGSGLTGTYGTLTLAADGTYTYAADQSAADDLDASDTATDVFTYTLSDGTATDTATITITITGVNDAPVADNETGSVNEDATLTVTDGTSDVLHGDTDADDSASLTVTTYSHTSATNQSGGSASSANGNSGTAGSGAVVGYYGTLTLAADGTYTYAADQSAADDLDASDTATDVFTYTLSDGTATDTATITITVTGINDAPVAQNDTGTVNEDATLTVSNSGNARSVAGASHDGTPYAINEGSIRSLTFNHDGTKMFVVHASTPAVISEHALTTAFDITTASQSTTYDVSSHTTSPRGLRFNSDGTKLYLNSDQNSNKKVYEFSLSTAYDISSLSSPSSTVISGQDGNPRGIAFNTDGSKMFLLGDSNNTVYEYSLSTAFDTTTISYTSRSLDFSSKEVTPRGLSFNSTGTKLFITGQNSDDILEYDLSTGFDLSTESFNGAFDMTGTVSSPNDVVFNNDGTKAFIGQTGSNKIFSFSLSSPFSLVDITGENTGDVLDTSSSSNSDSDADASASLTVTAIRVGSSEDSGTAGSIGSALTGTYGQLTIAANGSYSYVANQDAADALDAGDIVTDSFNYTVSDGTATDTAVITITVIGVNDAPSASNGTVNINENNQASTAGDRTPSNITKVFAVSDFNFADDDTSGSLTKVKITTLESAGALEYNNGSSWADVTLNQEITASDIGNNRLRFTPAANSESNPTFGFKVHDGTDYSSSAYTMTISVNAAPNVTDATVGSTVAAGGTSSGDVHDGVVDSDDNDSVLVVTGVASGNESSNNTIITNNTGVGSAVSGTYGSLNIAANGTYTYTASSTNNIAYDATATDIFTFTTRDDESNSGSNAYDVGTITFTVASSISLTDDTDSVNEDATITKTGSQDDVLNDDAADTNGLVVTHIKKDGGSNSTVASSSTYTSNGTSVTGTYGTLVIGADGSYTYTADLSAADDLDLNDEVTDVFVYTADGATANLTITVTGINDVPTAADKTVTTNEDTAYVFSASDFGYTDADDHDALVSVKITGLEDAGALQYNNGSAWVDVTENQVITATDIAANKLRFNPTANENGSSYTSFDFTVNDGDADSASANTITVNVTAVNDAPVADDETNSVNEDATVTVTDGTSDVLHGDTDVDSGDTLTVTTYSHTSATNQSGGSASSGNGNSGTAGTNAVVGYYGTLTLAADGTYTYAADQSAADDLDASDTATDVFTYTLSDGTATDTATIIITVTGINDAPAAVNDTDAVNEDATVTRTSGSNLLMADDSDADDDDSFTVTQIAVTGASNSSVASSSSYNSNFTSVTGTYGTLKVGADGTYTYVADQSASDDLDLNDQVTDSFTYTISDGTATDTATLIFTVTGINDAPVAVNDTDAVNEDATVTRTSGSSLLMADDSDADDDDSFTVTQIAVTGGSNNAVTASSTYNSGSPETVTGTYGTLTVGADGTYTYVADQNAADDLDLNDQVTDSFTYTISDGTATDTATLIFTVTGINDVPTAADKTVTTNEDTAYVFSASDFGYTDADDHDALVSVKITGLEDAGALQYNNGSAWVDVTENQVITATDIAANKLRFNPTANENGSSYTSFDFTVNDGDADSASANTITVNVTAVNDAPVADDETNSVNEDATVTVTDGTSDVLHGDTDVDSGDTLTVTTYSHTSATNQSGGSASSGNGNSGTAGTNAVVGYYGTLTLAADGTYTYAADQSAADDLDASDTATDVFTYTLSDGTATDTATIIITVTGINDAPAAVNDTDAVNEDATVTRTSGSNLLMADDSDADDDDSFTVTQIAVTGASNSSVASSSSYNSNFTSVTGTYGTLKVGADGTYTYVADQSASDDLDLNDQVTDSFTYTISDGTATDTATLIFTVTGINDAPVAVNDTDAVNEDATVTRTSGSSLLMADDSDADDDDSFTVTQIAVTGGSNNAVTASSTYNSGSPETVTGTYGTLTVGADGTYTYVADQNAADDLDLNDQVTDSFTYTISDGTATDTATLIFTVTGINDVPTAADKTVTTNEDTAYVFSASDFGYTDADDHDALVSVKITGLEDAGALQYNNGSAWVDVTENQVITATDIAANKLRFNPTANENGSSYTSFDFTVNDGDADSASANTITVNVTAVNDAPVADDETNSVNEDATVTVTDGTSDVLHGDTDVDSGDTLTVTTYSHTSATNQSGGSASSGNGNSGTAGTNAVVGYYGTLTLAADGTYTYAADQSAADDLDASDTATDVFTYTLSDGTCNGYCNNYNNSDRYQ